MSRVGEEEEILPNRPVVEGEIEDPIVKFRSIADETLNKHNSDIKLNNESLICVYCSHIPEIELKEVMKDKIPVLNMFMDCKKCQKKESYETVYQYREQRNNNAKIETCQTHNVDANLYCINCEKWVCDQCRQEHENHSITRGGNISYERICEFHPAGKEENLKKIEYYCRCRDCKIKYCCQECKEKYDSLSKQQKALHEYKPIKGLRQELEQSTKEYIEDLKAYNQQEDNIMNFLVEYKTKIENLCDIHKEYKQKVDQMLIWMNMLFNNYEFCEENAQSFNNLDNAFLSSKTIQSNDQNNIFKILDFIKFEKDKQQKLIISSQKEEIPIVAMELLYDIPREAGEEDFQIFGEESCALNEYNCRIQINKEKPFPFVKKMKLKQGENKIKVEVNGDVFNLSHLFHNCRYLKKVSFPNLDTSLVNTTESMFNNCSNLIDVDLANFITDRLSDMDNMFEYCDNLERITFGKGEKDNKKLWNTENVKSMRMVFSKCSKLTKIDNIEFFNTQNVTNMERMFDTCSSLAEIKVDDWNTSKVENFAYMFNDCTSLEKINVSKWDISSAKDISGLFYNCSSLDGIDVSGWKTDKCTSISSVFFGCSSLKEIDVSKWETKLVNDMSFAFNKCDNLSKIDVSKWDTSNVKTIEFIFSECKLLSELDVSNWDTSKVEEMKMAFDGCENLTELNVANWKVNNTNNMNGLFSECSKIRNLDLGRWITSNVTDMANLFSGCSDLESTNTENWNTEKVKDMSYMFHYCESLPKIDLSRWRTNQLENVEFMFSNCSSASEILFSQNFNTSLVKSLNNMFNVCSSLKTLDLSFFNISNVTEMESTFESCTTLEAIIGLDNLDVRKVETMINLFSGCCEYKKFNINNWNMRDAINLTGMFSYCTALDTVSFGQIGNNVTDMKEMFCSCENLENVYNLGNNRMENLIHTNSMFDSCQKLKQIELTNWQPKALENTSSMFKGCKSLSSVDFSKWDIKKEIDCDKMLDECDNLQNVKLGKFSESKNKLGSYAAAKQEEQGQQAPAERTEERKESEIDTSKP